MTVIAIIVLAAAALALWLYQTDLQRARRAARRGSQIIETDAGPIEYAERGAGIPLLSIHGAGGGFDQGLANVADFVGDSMRVIAPSRFGYLRTPAPADTSVTAQADAHAALLSRLSVAKAVVIGISAGARSAVEFAIRHPARVIALILIVPGTYASDSPVSVPNDRGSKFVLTLVNAGADFFWWAAQKLAPSLLVRFVGVRPELLAGLPQAARRRVMDIVASIEPLSQRMLGIDVDSVGPEREPRFDKITAPTLIISARDDLYNTAPAAAFAADRIRGAELVLFDTGGHLLAGHEDEVRQTVRAFLGRAAADIAA